MGARRLVLVLSALLPLACCEPDAACESAAEPTVELGRLGEGDFELLSEGERVPISIAPQGGFGMAVRVRTTGLHAADDTRATVHVATEIDGASVGQYVLYQQALLCAGDSGSVSTVVVPLDPFVYTTNEQLQALVGLLATLIVDVVDANDVRGHGEAVVTLGAGE
ncbi:MAG: hypothetical protein IT383_28045 [Deltaproteobacteria bacterium]|nr:hypothetical protein [Deltaproteobacteria bacterium]